MTIRPEKSGLSPQVLPALLQMKGTDPRCCPVTCLANYSPELFFFPWSYFNARSDRDFNTFIYAVVYLFALEIVCSRCVNEILTDEPSAIKGKQVSI